MNNLPNNPFVWFAAFLITILIGGGAGGAIVAIRKDVRTGRAEDIDLTAMIKKVAADTIADQNQQLQSLRDQGSRDRERIAKMERRLSALETSLARSRHLYRLAVSYIDQLLVYIALHLSGRTDLPPVPRELSEQMRKEEADGET